MKKSPNEMQNNQKNVEIVFLNFKTCRSYKVANLDFSKEVERYSSPFLNRHIVWYHTSSLY